MQKPFGYTLNIDLSWTRPWLSLGPGWAALAGAVVAGPPDLSAGVFASLLLLWILADPLLGTLWHLLVNQALWREVVQANLPVPPGRGFLVPYAQPGSLAGRMVVRIRQYHEWLRETTDPSRARLTTTLLAAALALLVGLYLHPAIFWLVILAIGLTWIAGLSPYDLTAPGGGRLQSVAQFLLPWTIGLILWKQPPPLGLLVGLAYWIVYLGGLRMFGCHHRAQWLYFGGQLAVALLLLGLQHLPAAAVVIVLLLGQSIVYKTHSNPRHFLPRVQHYLVIEIVVVALAIGWGL